LHEFEKKPALRFFEKMLFQNVSALKAKTRKVSKLHLAHRNNIMDGTLQYGTRLDAPAEREREQKKSAE
jgi:hypothetical protein